VFLSLFLSKVYIHRLSGSTVVCNIFRTDSLHDPYMAHTGWILYADRRLFSDADKTGKKIPLQRDA